MSEQDDGELRLNELHFKGQILDAQLEGGPARILAASFADYFREKGAKNYLEVSFYHDEIGQLAVTLQKVGGITPAARIAELEAENARLKVELDKAQTTLMAHEYVDAAPEGHPIKQMTQQKPKGVAAYPKCAGVNHLRKELDSYKAEQEGE